MSALGELDLSALDLDGDGEVDWREFVAAVLEEGRAALLRRLERAGLQLQDRQKLANRVAKAVREAQVVLVQSDGQGPTGDDEVHRLLVAAGLVRLADMRMPTSRVYVARSLVPDGGDGASAGEECRKTLGRRLRERGAGSWGAAAHEGGRDTGCDG